MLHPSPRPLTSLSPLPRLTLRFPWKRRPIFVWQLRVLLLTLLLLLILYLPSLLSHLLPYLHSALHSLMHAAPPNPCLGFPTPAPLPSRPNSTPPRIVFTHIPRAAGGLVARLLAQYATRTGGAACVIARGSHILSVDRHTSRTRTSPLHNDLRPTCRTLRGHVTFPPTLANGISLILLRHPVTRFVSVYEAARSSRERARWHRALRLDTLAEDFANSSSVLHHGYVDQTGRPVSPPNGLSFFFYGALPLLAGAAPRFGGEGDPFHFGLVNDRALAATAKRRLCATHVVGVVGKCSAFTRAFFRIVRPWARWTTRERSTAAKLVVNRAEERVSRNVDDHLPERMRAEVERRLRYEIEVFEFAGKIVAYREAVHGDLDGYS